MPAEQAAAAQAGGWQGILALLIPWILIFVVFYLLLILPQRKREKKIRAMLDALKVGDVVLTTGGIYGKIMKIKDDVLTIEVGADRIKLNIAKWSVKQVEHKA